MGNGDNKPESQEKEKDTVVTTLDIKPFIAELDPSTINRVKWHNTPDDIYAVTAVTIVFNHKIYLTEEAKKAAESEET